MADGMWSRAAAKMNQPALTIVMYHYVRPIAGSQYPRIRGLELTDFEGQLDYIERYHQVVSMAQVLAASRQEAALAPGSVLLTFDDGYLDHYAHVFPALARRGMTGVFFPPTCAVRDRRMLDVNKIHFILASVDGLDDVIAYMEEEVTKAGLRPVAEYREELRTPNRFDTADTMYVKRMLQFALAADLRAAIVDALFRRFVSQDEEGFAETVYMSESQTREMVVGGMSIGGHGSAHQWLDKMQPDDQRKDIADSLQWLEAMGASREHFLFCYPYGGYNAHTLAALRERNCAAAFTTKVDLAVISAETMLELPRLDTNDLPRSGDELPVTWTEKALKESAA
ncbi:MAG TPA: polysaccharide deacetylase family protein [Sphingobium sp.]|nr:polysaccharide deacetylase family protein [Sphingobium sp.]